MSRSLPASPGRRRVPRASSDRPPSARAPTRRAGSNGPAARADGLSKTSKFEPDQLLGKLRDLESARAQEEREKKRLDQQRRKELLLAKRQIAKEIQDATKCVKKSELEANKVTRSLTRVEQMANQSKARRAKEIRSLDEQEAKARGKQIELESALQEKIANVKEACGRLNRAEAAVCEFELSTVMDSVDQTFEPETNVLTSTSPISASITSCLTQPISEDSAIMFEHSRLARENAELRIRLERIEAGLVQDPAPKRQTPPAMRVDNGSLIASRQSSGHLPSQPSQASRTASPGQVAHRVLATTIQTPPAMPPENASIAASRENSGQLPSQPSQPSRTASPGQVAHRATVARTASPGQVAHRVLATMIQTPPAMPQESASIAVSTENSGQLPSQPSQPSRTASPSQVAYRASAATMQTPPAMRADNTNIDARTQNTAHVAAVNADEDVFLHVGSRALVADELECSRLGKSSTSSPTASSPSDPVIYIPVARSLQIPPRSASPGAEGTVVFTPAGARGYVNSMPSSGRQVSSVMPTRRLSGAVSRHSLGSRTLSANQGVWPGPCPTGSSAEIGQGALTRPAPISPAISAGVRGTPSSIRATLPHQVITRNVSGAVTTPLNSGVFVATRPAQFQQYVRTETPRPGPPMMEPRAWTWSSR